MHSLRALLVAISVAVASSAQAQVVDLSTITCKAFFEGPEARVSYVLAWMNAYYRDDDSPAVIDFDKMKADAVKLAEYCAKNPTVGLITAGDALFDSK
jgi:acid stress chaperone HdeB